MRFFTGLPGFDVLKATFSFISLFIARRSKSLSLFEEFIMVLMKLRLNVPLQDLAYRFGISLSTVSRTFSTWLTVMMMMMMMMIMNFIHVSMYLADANWGHNIKIK